MIARALEQILERNIHLVIAQAPDALPALETAAYLASFAHIDSAFLHGVVESKNVSISIRTRAAAALAFHTQMSDVPFWRTLNYNTLPDLLPIAVSALSELAPEEALKLVDSASDDQLNIVGYAVDAALRSLLRNSGGREWLSTFLPAARATVRNLIEDCESYRTLREIRSSTASSTAPIEKVYPAVSEPSDKASVELRDLTRAIAAGSVQPAKALQTFALLFPTHLQNVAREQNRPIADVLVDVAQLSNVNISGIQELANEQVHLPGLKEVWVFAKRPADLAPTFYSSVRTNIVERFVQYYYFQSNRDFFNELNERLSNDIGNIVDIAKYVHCILLPELAFMWRLGFGLLITEDIRHMRGKTVTAAADNGTIIQAQDMTPSQVREAYLNLRPLVEAFYQTIHPALEGESAQNASTYSGILADCQKIQ